jgi:hypothetical protein
MTVIRRLWLLIPLSLGVIALREAALFTSRSPEGAQPLARAAFLRECSGRHLKCEDYKGPDYQGATENAFKFSWTNVLNRDQILVGVFYGPSYTTALFIPASTKTSL